MTTSVTIKNNGPRSVLLTDGTAEQVLAPGAEHTVSVYPGREYAFGEMVPPTDPSYTVVNDA